MIPSNCRYNFTVEQRKNMMNDFTFNVSRFPPLPAGQGLFMAGTDTDVGKTLVAGAIARSLRGDGRRVEVFKPVATGCSRRREGLVSSDAEFLAACADSRRLLSEITPLRFRTAVAPNVAAAREHRDVDLNVMFDAYRELLAAGPDAVIVEGVGGLLCPIRDDFWVIHLAKLLALPVVIVARAGLGTINHTLLTLHAARSAGLAVAGVVVNRYRLEPPAGPDAPEPSTLGDDDYAVFTNPQQIAALGKVKVLALVPDEPENNVARGTIGEDTQFTVNQVDWWRLMGKKAT